VPNNKHDRASRIGVALGASCPLLPFAPYDWELSASDIKAYLYMIMLALMVRNKKRRDPEKLVSDPRRCRRKELVKLLVSCEVAGFYAEVALFVFRDLSRSIRTSTTHYYESSVGTLRSETSTTKPSLIF